MKHFKVILPLTLAALLLTSCGMQNKFASSFGKRRYNKGFYVDVPGNAQAPKQKSVTRISPKIVSMQIHSAGIEVPKPEAAIKQIKELSAITVNKISSLSKNQVSVIKSAPVTNAIASHHSGDENSEKDNSSLSKTALAFFIIAVFIALLCLLVLFVSQFNIIAFLLAYLGLIVAGAFDLLAIVLAFLSVAYGEKNMIGPKVVLCGNLALVLLYLVLIVASRRGI